MGPYRKWHKRLKRPKTKNSKDRGAYNKEATTTDIDLPPPVTDECMNQKTEFDEFEDIFGKFRVLLSVLSTVTFLVLSAGSPGYNKNCVPVLSMHICVSRNFGFC